KSGETSCWGWSDLSVSDAAQRGAKRAAELAKKFKDGDRSKAGRYGYGDRPLREELLKEFKDESGELIAALTRNSYGCLILNTSNLLMIDIDSDESGSSKPSGSFLSRLFGDGGRKDKQVTGLEEISAKAKSWLALNSSWSLRIYRTAAGFRILAPHATISPGDSVVERVFEHFACDPLYRKLCNTQKSFRARLTPKPWRCRYRVPNIAWPWSGEDDKGKFTEWEKGYSRASEGYASCKLEIELGSGSIVHGFEEIIKLHDSTTRASEALHLA
ncbi:MAG: hypothetical protein DCC75_13250, partial [Proteobacteria bacterium]